MDSDFPELKQSSKPSSRLLGGKLGRFAYWSAVAAVFAWAAWLRFRLPLDPIAVPDTSGYLSPALRKLIGTQFGHTFGRNFIYPALLSKQEDEAAGSCASL
jgi:hypothetical protein